MVVCSPSITGTFCLNHQEGTGQGREMVFKLRPNRGRVLTQKQLERSMVSDGTVSANQHALLIFFNVTSAFII
jgi:hypothetical protein